MKYEITPNNPVKKAKAQNGKTIRLPWQLTIDNRHLSDHRTIQGAQLQIGRCKAKAARKKLYDLEIKSLESLEYGLSFNMRLKNE